MNDARIQIAAGVDFAKKYGVSFTWRQLSGSDVGCTEAVSRRRDSTAHYDIVAYLKVITQHFVYHNLSPIKRHWKDVCKVEIRLSFRELVGSKHTYLCTFDATPPLVRDLS